ncbi:MAG: hypothetical protein KatS3mg010_1007 [Acidimicrobiia bacterium]|nr:MAG: hypothetical protein KatS3mg010_1007 [Acidimicrobiia bacterium]
MTARNDAALTQKIHSSPTRPASSAASTGPSTRVTELVAVANVMASESIDRGTTDGTSACAAGMFSMNATPLRNDSAETFSSVAEPVATRTPSTTAKHELRDLAPEQQAPAVEAVREHAAVQAEQELRQVGREVDDADRRRVPRQLVGERRPGEDLHPVAELRHEPRRPDAPPRGDAERREHGRATRRAWWHT